MCELFWSVKRIAFTRRVTHLILKFSSPSLLVPPNYDTATLAFIWFRILYREWP